MSDTRYMKPKEAAALLAKEHFKTEVKACRYLGGGSFGTAFGLTLEGEPKNIVVKLCKAEDMHLQEAFDLKMLKSFSPVPVPEVFFTHSRTEDIPFDALCMEFIDGRDGFTCPSLPFKSRRKKTAFAENVADALLEIHSHTNEKFGLARNPEFGEWLDYYRPFAEKVLNDARLLNKNGKFEGKILALLQKAYAHFDYIFSERVKEACFIHGDINVMNIMVEPKSFEIAAFIDPLNSLYADREYELFQLQNLTGNFYSLYETYKSKYPVSEKCDLKCAFYGLFNEAAVYIKTGEKVDFIMNAVMRRMKKQMRLHGLD